MAQALVLVGHGSPEADGNRQFLDLVSQVRAAVSDRPVLHCFIEHAEPDVATGLDACARQGATRVAVLPMTLFAANHAKLEIPGFIDAARERHPGVSFHYGRPFGIDPLILGILSARFREVEAAHGPFARADTAAVIVGRGSSDPDANSDLAKVARIFLEKEGLAYTDICYTGVTRPDLPTAVRRLVTMGFRRVVVLPYFLFTGVLIHRIEGWVAAMQAEFPEVAIHLGGYFGQHPDVVELILAREREALAGSAFMNCDQCRFRLLAPEILGGKHHHHHHHHGDLHGKGHRHD